MLHAIFDPEVNWPLAVAWDAAVQASAAAYQVPPEAVSAESRGRGPRPPEAVREPRKLAVYIAVSLSGCDYAVLGRHVGLHKDTVASHCAWAREACALDDDFERRVEVLTAAAALSMQVAGVHPSTARKIAAVRRATSLDRLRALEEHMAKVFADARAALSDDVIRPFPASSDEHAKLIAKPGNRERAA